MNLYMSKNMALTKIDSRILLNEIHLDNVTLNAFGRDAILQSVDLALPMDQTVIVESSNPQNSVYFLQLIAGRMNCNSGQLLWNGENIFAAENEINTNQIIASYFENHFFDRNQTVENLLKESVTGCEFDFDQYDIFEQFEIEKYRKTQIKNLSYEFSKLVFLIKVVLASSQAIVLEDPAVGLSECNWLQLLDLIHYQQRRGHLRHIYMTNHHPTALQHLAFNKVFIEDGLLYFDEAAGYKKASHF